MLVTNNIKCEKIIGKNNNEIENSSNAIWNFNNTELINAIIENDSFLITLYEYFFVSTNFFIYEDLYPNIFSSLQNALNSIKLLKNLPEKIYILCFGNFEEKIIIEDLDGIELIGIGNPALIIKDNCGEELIKIKNSSNIKIKNFRILDKYNYLNTNVYNNGFNIFSLENNSNCFIENIISNLNIKNLLFFNFIKIITSYGKNLINNNNVNINFELDNNVSDENFYLSFLNYNGNGTEGSIQFINNAIKYKILKKVVNKNLYITYAKILTDINKTYNFFFNNSQFEYNLDILSNSNNIYFDFINAKDLNDENEKYNKIYLFNSFSNKDYHIDIHSNNVIVDSTFVIN